MSDLAITSITPTDDANHPSLAVIRRRLEAVGEHSWEVVCDASTEVVGVMAGDYDDADLIANAPTDIAWLLDEVERVSRFHAPATTALPHDDSVVQGVTKLECSDG